MAPVAQLPESIGPYRALELLGAGGMGVVYRARHHETGRLVALKTVRVPRPGLLSAIRREIHALARLRHPGIVRIVDQGVEQGLPWYAMELLEGITLRQHMAGPPGATTLTRFEPDVPQPWWTQSLSRQVQPRPANGEPATASPDRWGLAARGLRVPEVLNLAFRLCAPLAFLHGDGLVHRDLKPENILIRPDGRPVLVDFGLTLRFGDALSRDALEIERGAGGTVAYMAPEQGRGETVDARADLYALGCILYELLTGRPPFFGASVAHFVQRHASAAPRPPSELAAGVPPELDALVLRLLEKEPRARFGYAVDVALALGRLGAEAGLETDAPRPRAYLYRPGFAGRKEELKTLKRRVNQLMRGQGALLLIGGESGVGKTRLVLEAVQEAQARGVCVLASQCRPVVASGSASEASETPLEALRPLLQSIADHCREQGPAETERLLGRRGKVLALYEPALQGLPGQVEAQDVAPLPAAAARLRLLGDLADTLAAYSQRQAILFVLDDLQWADRLTLDLLELLLRSRRLEKTKLLILGTYRSEETSEALRSLLARADVQHLDLRRLTGRAVGAIVCDMLALQSPPAAFVRFLSRHSEGNPFFVAEYLRTAVREGLLWRDPAGWWQVAGPSEQAASEAVYEALPLPDSVVELVGRRLEKLSGRARRLTEAAAVAGREVDVGLVTTTAGLDGLEALECQSELLALYVLEDSGDRTLRFVHDKIREVAYARIEPEQRRRLHRATAEAFEASSGREERLAALGHHWEAAGEPVKAAGCYLAAARAATLRYAHEEAERLYRAYLRLTPEPGPEAIHARNELAADLHLRGRPGDAVREHERALAEARQLGDLEAEAQSLQMLANVQSQTSRLKEAHASCVQALAITRQLGDRLREASILGNLGLLEEQMGRLESARSLYEQALDSARQLGDRVREGYILGNLAILRLNQGYLDDARERFGQVLALAREIGSRRMEGSALHNLASLGTEQGRLQEASALFEQALAIHAEVGNRRFEGVSLSGAGTIYRLQGRLEEARQFYERALVVHREVDHLRFEAKTLVFLGSLRLEQGHPGEARALLQAALDLARNGAYSEEEAMALYETAILERQAAGDLGQAEAFLLQAEALSEARELTLDLARCCCERGHLQLAQGRSARACLVRAEALASRAQAGGVSPVGRSVDRLRRAIEAFEAGDHHRLFRGECVEGFPAGLRRTLAAGASPEQGLPAGW